MRYTAERMQNAVVNLNINVPNRDSVDDFIHNVRSLHDIQSNIHPHIDNMSEINNELDKFKQPINKEFNFTSGDGNLGDINERIRKATINADHFGNSLSTVGRTGSSSLNGLNTHVNRASGSATHLANTGNKIHGIFSGTFLGNAFSNVFSSFKTDAESAIKSGIKLVSVGRDTQRAWHNIGLNNNQANSMTNQMADIRDKAGMDEQSIDMMQKSFYSLTGSAPKARSLTNELVSFGKATGESDQQIARMGKTLPRMLSTGKVSGQMFNRTFRQSPALINAIAKASGHTTGQFRQLAANGKITSAQLEQYMEKAAGGSSKAWDEYASTFQGQLNVINGTWTRAKENFARPFVSNLTRAINQTTRNSGGLFQVQKSVGQISNLLGKRVGNWSGKAIGWITKNQRPLIHIGKELFLIASEIGRGAWKEFSGILRGITGSSRKTGNGLHQLDFDLTDLANHSSQLAKLGKVLVNVFMIHRVNKFNKSIIKTFHSLTKFRIIKSLQDGMRSLNSKWQDSTRLSVHFRNGINNIRHSITGAKISMQTFKLETVGMTETQRAATLGTKAFSLSIRGIGKAITTVPLIGWIQLAIDGITLVYTHSAKFRRLVNPMLRGIGHMIGWIGDKIADCVDWVIKWSKRIGDLVYKVTGFFHSTKVHAASTSGSMNRYTRNSSRIYKRSQQSNTSATRHAHKAIDRYRSHSDHQFRAYISKSGRIYRNYHKGTTRISETTYKQREALRQRYYRRYAASLRKYEHNYRAYEHKRSSLSRRYGKLRAMYSVKSLDLIEKRFKKLKSMVVGYAKAMFKNTQYWFRRLGTGVGHQFRGIYRDVRKYMHMSNGEAVKDFKTLYRNSRRWLNGSVNKYVRSLRYRYKRQRYYDRQLVRQAKKTGQAMYRLPLGWITRETRDLVRNWRHQRRSFVTHNKRMTHAEVSHIGTMDDHLKRFRDRFEDMMSNLEDNIYKGWSKFWDKMHDRAGSGINSVEKPLNSGAEHINSFVRAFGETTSPMHSMPMVSYATGTGMRRPITRMVQATLNDGHDSPETNNQETVIRPNGSVEFPKGQNIQETLEPGTEVLNATETKLMSQMAHFAPTVHLATGTGLFGGLFGRMSSWIRSALSGQGSNDDYSSIWSQAKGSGYHKLLHILQKVLGHSEQVLAGFMGHAPSGYRGALGDITQGIYGQTSNQIDAWWKALMNLTNQTLNQDGSSNDILNYAIKNWTGVPYSGGGVAHSGADCGGAIQSILRHFNIGISHTDMEDSPAVKFIGTDASKARPGDLVMFGKKSGSKSGYSSHVGIFERPGEMWSEHPPKSGQESINSAAAADGLWGYYRIKHAPQNNNLPSFKGANKGLMNFVKHQESPYLKFIEKHLEPLLDFSDISGTAGAWTHPGTQAHHIAQDVFEAAEHLGLDAKHAAAVVGNAWHESAGFQYGLKVNQFGGGGGKGLFQFTGQGSKYGWSPLGQVKSILANALSGSASSWEHSHGDPSSLAHSFETIFERGSIPAFASRDAAAERAYYMFGDGSHYAKGGRFHAGQLMTVGEHGAELIKPDVSGEVIPHNETKRILNSDNSHPVKVNQTVNLTVKDGSNASRHEILHTIEEAGDTLATKLSRSMGFDDGGRVI